MNVIETAAEALRPAISAAAKEAVNKSVGLDMADAHQITADVTREVSAVLVNQTNQEPWYQSTVTIGALVTLVGGGYNLVYEIAVNGPPEPAAFTALASPVIGAMVTLYGRWLQRKPIGT